MTQPKAIKTDKIKKKLATAAPLNEDEKRDYITKIATSSPWLSGIAHEAFGAYINDEVKVVNAASAVHKSIKKMQSGDHSDIEAMLFSQAKSLEWIFTSLARKASLAERLPNYQAFMGLALKAQSQSRATLQALMDFRNPKQVSFVKQTNIASGHQQINNAQLEIEKNPITPSKLIEGIDDGSTSMDTRTASQAKPSYQKVEAVGEIHGAKNSRG